MKTLIVNAAVWKQTSGLANSGQLMSGSYVPEVFLPNLDTLPSEEIFHEQILELAGVQAPSFPVDVGHNAVSPEEVLLRNSLTNLLQFTPSPDEPTDEDIGNRLKYKFPD